MTTDGPVEIEGIPYLRANVGPSRHERRGLDRTARLDGRRQAKFVAAQAAKVARRGAVVVS